MKRLAVITMLIFIEMQFIYCSAGYPPPPPLFVNAEISGAVHIAPLFLTDSSFVTLIAGAAYSPSSSVAGHVIVEGTGEVRTDNTQNLNWKIPATTYTLGINFQIYRAFAVFTTINFDSREGFKFAGPDFGLGLTLLSRKEISARLNLGLYHLGMNYDANFQTSARDVNYQEDPQLLNFKNTSKGLKPFISLVMNTALPDWLVNPFLQVSYNQQTMFTLPDSYRQEVSCRIAYFTFTPGISYKLSENFMVLAGSNIVLPENLNYSSSDLIVSGFAQVNFRISYFR